MKNMSIKEILVLIIGAVAVFLGMPNARACDTAVVVDTWVQDPGKPTGQIVVRQFCPLAGPAAVPVSDAKPVLVESKAVIESKTGAILAASDAIITVRFAGNNDVVLIYEDNIFREVRMYPHVKGSIK